jgi:IMP dehydrogenase / GMP reductase domain.
MLTAAAAEAAEATVPQTGPVGPRLEEFVAGIRSRLSYVGAHDLATARECAEFIEATPASSRRDGPHGVAREE